MSARGGGVGSLCSIAVAGSTREAAVAIGSYRRIAAALLHEVKGTLAKSFLQHVITSRASQHLA